MDNAKQCAFLPSSYRIYSIWSHLLTNASQGLPSLSCWSPRSTLAAKPCSPSPCPSSPSSKTSQSLLLPMERFSSPVAACHHSFCCHLASWSLAQLSLRGPTFKPPVILAAAAAVRTRSNHSTRGMRGCLQTSFAPRHMCWARAES